MLIGVDASNIRGAGGTTHLSRLLEAAQGDEYGITRVVVWGGRHLLDELTPRPWLKLVHQPMLDGPLLTRLRWQLTRLSGLAKDTCDLLYVPGGTYLGRFHPFVCAMQSALPFFPRERARYGLSWMRLRLTYLRVVQGRTLRTADAVIYPSTASRVLIASQVGSVWERSAVVPHGVERRFVRPPRPQRPISAYSEERPYRLLYVSMIDVYKHQWHVAEAVAALRARQLPVTLDLVGPAYGPALRRLQRALRRTDPAGTSIRYLGPAAFSEMHTVYHQADAFVFASTCETFALPVLEAMTAGLPIACSNRPPMSEMLGEGAVFFNPEEPRDITRVLQQMILSSQERERLASVAFARAKDYSWGQCAAGTFGVLAAAAAPRSNGPAETRGGKGADRLTRCEGESNDY